MPEIENLDVKIIAALIGIIGIFVTGLLASIGFYFRSRLEVKRSARRVLYLLLELRHTILNSLFDPETEAKTFIKDYVTEMNRKGVPLKEHHMDGAMKNIIVDSFSELLDKVKVDIQSQLLAPLEKSLLSFSEVNPVLAFHLKGKEKLEVLIDHTNFSFNSLDKLIAKREVKENRNAGSSTDLRCIKEQVINELISTLNSDIMILAKHTGLFDRVRCKKLLAIKEQPNNKSPYLENFVNCVIDEISKSSDQVQVEKAD